MTTTQIIVVGIVGVSIIILLGCLILIVIARLRRVMTLQFETIDKLLSAVRADQARDKPAEPAKE